MAIVALLSMASSAAFESGALTPRQQWRVAHHESAQASGGLRFTAAGFGGALLTSGSFTMMAAGGGF